MINRNRTVSMPLCVTVVVGLLLTAVPVLADECSVKSYGALVAEGKRADEGRQWDKSAAIYTGMLADCTALISAEDLVKAHDALAIAQLMTENYSAAIETAKKCLQLDPRFNSCLMTAAKGYEGLGDREMAISFARDAVEVGGYDDYSAAVVILAKDYLKKMEKGSK